MAPARRRLAIVATLVVVVIAGCSGSGGLTGGGDGDAEKLAAAGADDVDRTATAAAEEPGSGSGSGAPDVRKRARIRTGELRVEVDDFDAARRNLSRGVKRYGGFVSDSTERLRRAGGGNYTVGSVVLRVPADNFSAAMGHARTVGTVIESEQNTKDVTDQLVDINARLENLRAQRDRLRALYRNASDTEAILKIQERLSEVQTKIERLEAEKKSLRRQVALSTIRVELREPRPEGGPVERDRWYDTGIAAAFLASVDGVVVVVRALVVGAAYALPYLLAFGLPVAAGVAVLRRRRNDAADEAGDDPG